MGCEISSLRKHTPRRRETATEPKQKKNRRASLRSVANMTKMLIGSSSFNGTKRRNSVLSEMMETERKYVEDLETIRDVYLFPMLSKIYPEKNIPLRHGIKVKDVPRIREGDFKSLFAALQDVLRANQRLLRDLNEIVNKEEFSLEEISLNGISDIASCLLKHLKGNKKFSISSKKSNEELFYRSCEDYLKGDDDEENTTTKSVHMMEAYASYITLYRTRTIPVYQELKRNKSFQKFIDDNQSKDPSCLDLQSLLILPVQRLPRIKLLLKNIMKLVPRSGQSNKTYSKLEEAVKELDNVLACTESSIIIHNVNELKTKLGCDVWDVKRSLLNEEDIKDHFSLRQSLPTRQLTQEQFDSVRSAVHCVVENNIKDRSVEVEGNMIVFKGCETLEVHGKKKVFQTWSLRNIFVNTKEEEPHRERYCALLNDRFVWAKKNSEKIRSKNMRRPSIKIKDEFALRGVILLKDVCNVRDVDKYTFAFVVEGCKDPVYIQADWPSDKEHWMNAVRKCRDACEILEFDSAVELDFEVEESTTLTTKEEVECKQRCKS